MLYSFYPVFVGIWLTLDRQPISRVTILRLFLSLPAIYLLTQQGLHPVDALGAVFLRVSSALYALHLIINQRVLYEVPAQTVNCLPCWQREARSSRFIFLLTVRYPP